jgi:hypothetical protein
MNAFAQTIYNDDWTHPLFEWDDCTSNGSVAILSSSGPIHFTVLEFRAPNLKRHYTSTLYFFLNHHFYWCN